MSVRFLLGDCRSVLATLPDASVHIVCTSPPYWGLRDYNVEGQIGLEQSPDAYVAELVAVFREVRRVLRDDGTCWLNLGDSYAGGGRGGNPEESHFRKQATNAGSLVAPTPVPLGAKPKDLLMIPARVALALQAPDYLGRIKRETDRAWLAALVDGEGCITILETSSSVGSGNSYPPVLQIRMCDRECLEHARSITGIGPSDFTAEPIGDGGIRHSYQWRLNANKAVDTIAEIYPFLLVKRKQAIVAWNHQLVRDGYETKRGVKIPTDALEKQKVCRALIQSLNRRESVDLPSWMVEPPLPIGPGWYLRSSIIWAKRNCMPESVRDRPTTAHEHIFLLTKRPKYFYDAVAIEEDAESDHPSGNGYKREARLSYADKNGARGQDDQWNGVGGKRNKRSVWWMATQPFSEAHFATFPTELAETCIKAGTSERGCCSACGAPWVRQVKKARTFESGSGRAGYLPVGKNGEKLQGGGATLDVRRGPCVESATTGWLPSCSCRAGVVPATVLDPFSGAGTTALVADRLGRDAIGIELNAEYVAMSRRRLEQDAGMFGDVAAE